MSSPTPFSVLEYHSALGICVTVIQYPWYTISNSTWLCIHKMCTLNLNYYSAIQSTYFHSQKGQGRKEKRGSIIPLLFLGVLNSAFIWHVKPCCMQPKLTSADSTFSRLWANCWWISDALLLKSSVTSKYQYPCCGAWCVFLSEIKVANYLVQITQWIVCSFYLFTPHELWVFLPTLAK